MSDVLSSILSKCITSMMSICPNFSEVNLGILVKVVSARFFHCELKILVVDTRLYFGSEYVFYSSSNYYLVILASPQDTCLNQHSCKMETWQTELGPHLFIKSTCLPCKILHCGIISVVLGVFLRFPNV